MKIPEDLTKKLRDEIIPMITKEAKYMIHSEKVPSPTLAEVFEIYRNEGIEKGIEKGRLEERRNLACELIREKFSNEKIARMTKLSIEDVIELRRKL
ncbi:RpnC/YadD family protein [Heyndrickxia sporothermodurans]|uniref:hypothetical protein n=2 Tax=Heyndrickxia sporothermodurans TaxID=46224 RepID=UPI0036CE86EA